MKIIKNFFQCFGCLIITGVLFYLLLLCLEVKSYHHFIFVSHNVAAKGDTNNIKAEILFNLSNTEIANRTSIKFLPNTNPRRDGILVPQYHTIDDISRLSGLKITQLYDNAQKAGIPRDSITDLYTVVNLETAWDLPVLYHEEKESADGCVFLFREKMMKDRNFRVTHANIIESVLKDAIYQEKLHDTNTPFQYCNKKLIDKSYYLITSKGKQTEVPQNYSSPNMLTWIDKCLEPHDITREEHFFIIHSEAIDTVALTLKFDEKVEFSPFKKNPTIKNYKELRFNDLTTYGEPRYEVESKYLYQNNNNKIANIHSSYYRQKSRENELSFWVKYESSEKIQWFRLFFITTFLGLFITLFILSTIRLGSIVIKSFRKSNK